MAVLEITTYGRNTLRRRRREARLVGGSRSPGLAPAYELDPCAATPTLLTEDLPDVTLDDLVGISPLPAAAALHALRDVARTLEAMHGCGLVHGELGPRSVFVLPDGRAALSRPAPAPPGSGTSDVDVRAADAYDFAVLAYELLTGAHPLDPGNPSSMATALSDIPPNAAIELGWALTAGADGRPVPLDLVDALDAVAPEEWSTNHLRRIAPTVPLAPPLDPTLDPPPDPPPVAGTAAVEETLVLPDPPPLKRSLFRRVLAPFVILLGLTTVVAGGCTGAWLLASDGATDDAAAAAVSVRRISISVTPPQALCPRASLHLAASIVTEGGGGRVEVLWRLPDGSITETQTLLVGAGRRTTSTAFDLTLTGAQRLVGEIVAEVGPDGAAASAPLRYLCPGASPPRQRDA